jgi:AcrR family transcriptional regulator
MAPATSTGSLAAARSRTEDPRVTRSKAAVLTATLEMLRDVGLGGLTIEGIAARSGVAKTTIYRHWGGCGELAFQSIESIMDTPRHDHTSSLRNDLLAALTMLVDGLKSAPWAAVLPTMVDAAERDEHVLILAREFAARRRASLEQRLEDAVAQLQLPADTDVELLASELVGPLFYRRFISRQPVSAAYAERHLDVVLRGAGALVG